MSSSALVSGSVYKIMRTSVRPEGAAPVILFPGVSVPKGLRVGARPAGQAMGARSTVTGVSCKAATANASCVLIPAKVPEVKTGPGMIDPPGAAPLQREGQVRRGNRGRPTARIDGAI